MDKSTSLPRGLERPNYSSVIALLRKRGCMNQSKVGEGLIDILHPPYSGSIKPFVADFKVQRSKGCV